MSFCFARVFLHSSSTLIPWKKLPFNKSPQIHGEKTLPTLKQHLPKSTENLNEDWPQLCNCAPVLASHQREAHEAIRLLTLGRRDNPKTRDWGCLMDLSKTAFLKSKFRKYLNETMVICLFSSWCSVSVAMLDMFVQVFLTDVFCVSKLSDYQKPFRTVAMGNHSPEVLEIFRRIRMPNQLNGLMIGVNTWIGNVILKGRV